MVMGVATKRRFSFKNLKENWRFVLSCIVVIGAILYLWYR
jgi:hypothetical protein